MSSHVLSSPLCCLYPQTWKTYQRKTIRVKLWIFSPKLKKGFLRHGALLNVLSEASLLWSIYMLSVAAVFPQRIHSTIARLSGLCLNLFCLSLLFFFFPVSFFSPILCHYITSHCLSPFFCSSSTNPRCFFSASTFVYCKFS